MPAEDGRTPISLKDYLRLLGRRKWVFIGTALSVPAIAVALALHTAPTYEASAKVLLSSQNDPGATQAYVDPARLAQTQADLARVQEVTDRAVEDAQVPGLTSDVLLTNSSVVASPDSDFLTFSVKNTDPRAADHLAMTYARAYVAYRFTLDSDAVSRARAVAERHKKALEEAGLGTSAAHLSVEQQIAALDATGVPALVVLHGSYGPVKVGPRVKRNGGIALILGIVLGLALAFLWDALDPRVRSLETLRNALPGLPLLGNLPPPTRPLRKKDRLVMLTGPTGPDAEPVRVLRANFESAVREVVAKTIMFTSAVGDEGKTTTAANLAVALARAGRRVVLIDFDLRNPGLHRFFGLGGMPGLIDVTLYDAPLESALADVRLTHAEGQPQRSSPARAREGTLEVMPLGGTLHDPDEVRADVAVRQIVNQIRGRADYILIDAGPLLPTGDSIALSAHIDAMVLVLRLNLLPVSALDDLGRVLASSRAAKLGFVVTGVEATAHKQSQHSGSPRSNTEVSRPRAAVSGGTSPDGERTNGAAATSNAEEQPFAAEY